MVKYIDAIIEKTDISTKPTHLIIIIKGVLKR
jgi:hypothetical protein